MVLTYRFLSFNWWHDVILGLIAVCYVGAVPYTKVEESFNIQAIHDFLYHRHHLEKYDHLEFPGVVPRTFIGAVVVALFSYPVVLFMSVLHLNKFYALIAVRLTLGCMVLSTLRFFRLQIRHKFGHQVETFFVIITSVQFHYLYYCTRTLPNVLSLIPVNLAYGYWLQGRHYAALNCLIVSTLVFRCEMLLLLCPLALELLLMKSISIGGLLKHCLGIALLSVALTVSVDSLLWRRLLWPEFDVFWFNSILNRSSEWGTHPFHWYFTSALPRSLLGAYPLLLIGLMLDRRIVSYVIPVFLFVIIYSKLAHKELRFIISAIPMFNLSAAVAMNRIYNNRKKTLWKFANLVLLALLLVSVGCTGITFMATYDNYPSGYAMKELHQRAGGSSNEKWVHIDTFSAMNGISRFCENDYPWRYSKEEGIGLDRFRLSNFTYLISEHLSVDDYQCLFAVEGFSKARLQLSLHPVVLVRTPKVYVHGKVKLNNTTWRGCP